MKISYFIQFICIFFSLMGKAQQYNKKQIDSIEKTAIKLTENNPKKAIILSEKMYKASKDMGYSRGMALALENIAFCYFNMGQLEKCIEYATREEEIATKADDYYFICAALRLKAASYSALGLYDDADKNINKAFPFAEKIVGAKLRHEMRGALYQSKSNISFYKFQDDEKMKNDSMFVYNRKAVKEYLFYLDENNPEMMSLYNNLISSYIDLKKYDSAQYYLDKVSVISKNSKNSREQYNTLFLLGRLSDSKADYQKAIEYYLNAVQKAKQNANYYDVRNCYRNLKWSYAKMKNKEKEVEYLEKYTQLNDSLINVEKSYLKTPLKQIKKEKEESFNDQKNKLYLIISGVCLLLLAASYFGYRIFKNYKREREEKQQKEIIIEEKESKLSEMEQKVNDAFEEVLELAKTDDSSFLTRFSEVYPEFVEKLTNTYPSLTSGQLKFCALLRLNFSTKEIAHYTHISDRSVEIKKSRLRKQLDIPSSEDLNKWMINF